MNRKIFGVKIGTILTVLLSLVAAVLFWLFVKYAEADTVQAIKTLLPDLVRRI